MAVGIMIVVTFAAIPLFCHDIYLKEMLEAWAVSVATGAAGTWMRRRATAGSSAQFMGWGVFGSVLRLLVIVSIVIVYSVVNAGYLPAFAVTVVVGYLSFTATEVGALYHQAVDSGKHE